MTETLQCPVCGRAYLRPPRIFHNGQCPWCTEHQATLQALNGGNQTHYVPPPDVPMETPKQRQRSLTLMWALAVFVSVLFRSWILFACLAGIIAMVITISSNDD